MVPEAPAVLSREDARHGAPPPVAAPPPIRVIASRPGPPPAWLAGLDGWQRQRPAAAFVWAVVRKFRDDRAGHLAALVSYFAFFSLFPLGLAFTSLLAMVLEDNEALRDRIAGTAASQIPIIGPGLRVGELTGSVTTVVLGAAVALWSGLKVIDAAQRALNDVWDVPMVQRPGLVRRRVRSVLLVGLVGVSLLASVAVGILVEVVFDLPIEKSIAIYIVGGICTFGVFLVTFKLLSDAVHTWRELVPGALFATFGWFLVEVPGAVYIEHVTNSATRTYQNFAAVIGLLTFFFLASQAVIIGAEINVVRARRLWPRSLTARYGELTPADETACEASATATTRVPSQWVVVGFGPVRKLR